MPELSPETYSQLKKIAHARLVSFQPGMTLNCTALVHEAVLKLHDSLAGQQASFDEAHFLAVASLAMRQILVDYVRANNAQKRGGGALHLTLNESQVSNEEPSIDLLELDQALERLAQRDPDLQTLVMLRFFAGLSLPDIARVLGRSPRSVGRDWTRARLYLFQYLDTDDNG